MALLLDTAQEHETQIIVALRRLVKQGWLPLRQLSPLLGYKYPTGIYSRKHTKRAIPTTKVGGTYRAYAADILEALKQVPIKDQAAAQTILSMYRQLTKEQEQDHE